MMENKVTKVIDQEKVQKINTLLDELEKELKTVTVPLTNEQRREMLKLGDKTLAFVQNSVRHAEMTPSLVPSFLDVKDMKIDLKVTEQTRKIFLRLEKLLNLAEDTYMVAGSELYDGSLLFYNNVKGGVRANIPGAKEAYEDLKVRFPGRPSKADTEMEATE